MLHGLGAEIRLTRRGAGISLRAAAETVGLSHARFGRLERGTLGNASILAYALACAAVGLKLVARAYPDGDPVRDAAHARLLHRLRERASSEIAWRYEVPLGIPGDLRAWDAQCTAGGAVICVEAEMRLDDLQALERRIALKRRDGGDPIVILLIADTESNRRRVTVHRESLRPAFPLDSRVILAALGAGKAPTSSGIVIL